MKVISKLSIIANMMEKMNFVIEFHKGTPMESVVRKEWKNIAEIEDLKTRAISERAFYKEHEIPFHAIVAMIVKQLCDVAEDKGMPLCSFDGNAYYYNDSYWQMIDQTELAKFLSDVAVGCSLNKKIAISASIVKILVQQFHSYASRTELEGNDDCVKINLFNGTLKIDSEGCTLEPFSADDFMRYQLSVAYDENAQTNLFQQFLNRVLPEKESQDFLAEYIGYALTNNLKLEQCLLLIGSGANGKSVVFDIVNALLGNENITHYTLSQLCNENGYYRSMISGKLLNYSSELGTNLSDVDMIKKLISGEPVDARNPYGRPFTVRKYCKFMFNTNSLPTSVEISDAYFRRMNFMQFDVTIPKSEQDPGTCEKNYRK